MKTAFQSAVTTRTSANEAFFYLNYTPIQRTINLSGDEPLQVVSRTPQAEQAFSLVPCSLLSRPDSISFVPEQHQTFLPNPSTLRRLSRIKRYQDVLTSENTDDEAELPDRKLAERARKRIRNRRKKNKDTELARVITGDPNATAADYVRMQKAKRAQEITGDPNATAADYIRMQKAKRAREITGDPNATAADYDRMKRVQREQTAMGDLNVTSESLIATTDDVTVSPNLGPENHISDIDITFHDDFLFDDTLLDDLLLDNSLLEVLRLDDLLLGRV